MQSLFILMAYESSGYLLVTGTSPMSWLVVDYWLDELIDWCNLPVMHFVNIGINGSMLM